MKISKRQKNKIKKIQYCEKFFGFFKLLYILIIAISANFSEMKLCYNKSLHILDRYTHLGCYIHKVSIDVISVVGNLPGILNLTLYLNEDDRLFSLCRSWIGEYITPASLTFFIAFESGTYR